MTTPPYDAIHAAWREAKPCFKARFCHARRGNTLWLMPHVPPPRSRTGIWHEGRRARCPQDCCPTAFSYWFAHALRQDLWRLLRGVRACLPIIAISGDTELRLEAGALMPQPTQFHINLLGTLLESSQEKLWHRWAVRKSCGTRGISLCSKKS